MAANNNRTYGGPMHNCYTMRAKSGSATAFNQMAPDFWAIAATHTAWAKTLALTDSDGDVLTVPAQLKYVDCNIERGSMLRAVYYGSVRCVQGHRYVRVALCCDDAGTHAASAAELDFLSAGEDTEITAVVYLEIAASDSVHFCGGNNGLARRLLGCGKQLQLSVGWGTCTYPARVFCRTSDGIEGLSAAQLAADETGLKIASDAPTQGSELLLCGDDGVPLLRALRPYTYAVRTVYETVTDKSAVLLPDNRPESVFAARLGDDTMLRVDTCRVCDAVYPVNTENVVHLGADGQVMSDPGEEYLGVITAAYVQVYRVDCLDLIPVVRLPRTDERVYICRGGAVALWDPDTLTIYEPDDDGEYTSFSVALSCGNDSVVLREGTRYHAAYRKTGTFYRYELTRTDGLKLKEQAQMTATLSCLGRCGDAILRVDRYLKVKTLDADLSAEFACADIYSRLTARTYQGKGDYFAVTQEGGAYYIYDFVHNAITAAAGALTANGRLLYNDDGVYVYDFYHGVQKKEGNYNMQGVSSACLAGDGLFAVRNNDLYVYYCSGNAMAVRMPTASTGKQFFANVREQVPQGLGRGVRFTLGAPQEEE